MKTLNKYMVLLVLAIASFVAGCGGDKPKMAMPVQNAETKAAEAAPSDPQGVGKYRDMQLATTLDASMSTNGKGIYEVKCLACHKLTDEKLVGPGWKGVTSRRRPEWIMNFVTNVETMLNSDENAKAMLELCMVRMPNQNLTDQDARDVLEFMRQNDGLK